MSTILYWFDELSLNDINEVGGKNASLGEMIQQLTKLGIKVPYGFATTASAYRQFLQDNNLNTSIKENLKNLDIQNVSALAKTGQAIRDSIMQANFSSDFENQVRQAYEKLISEAGSHTISVAVRSSATAEDLPSASFAGQQETLLNVQGFDNVLSAIKQVFASLYNDRAIAYRVHQGFADHDIALSAGIQLMVRSDCGASGVMFSVDTESGFDEVVFITSAYGLGECVVQGSVNPDEFYVYKPNLKQQKPAIIRKLIGAKQQKMIYDDANMTKVIEVEQVERQHFSITDQDVEQLARYALIIEEHYQRPMDIEWGKDGHTGDIYILQARPETVTSQQQQVIKRFQINQHGPILCEGRAIGQQVGTGRVINIKDSSQMHLVQDNDVLVTDMTDPDWEPVMKKAAAIVTNRGGRTCHAAIIARELGIPAVVGCGNATDVLSNEQVVTVSCAEGDTGYIYQGQADVVINEIDLNEVPQLPVKIMMNIAHPDRAFAFQQLPNHGIGLARVEFIVNNNIGIHPKALLTLDQLPLDIQNNIAERINAYESPREFFIAKLTEGIATLAAAFAGKPVIVRLSDFKSNEYARLIGGELFEPDEENPMLGFRGASRYIADSFKDCFALECQAIKRVREQFGFNNVEIMIPFVRTLNEAKQVIDVLAENGLVRGQHGLRIIMMCELPSNALLADDYLNFFDGFSIGSNDLTQLTLGLDRDSAIIASQFDERDMAVKKLLSMAINACKARNKYIGICGQGPSDHPDFAAWLIEQGIESLSLNPDSVLESYLFLAKQNH